MQVTPSLSDLGVVVVRPYYQQDGITIYHGDALDVLPSLAENVSALVMDPPYASGARTEAENARAAQCCAASAGTRSPSKTIR